MSTESKRAFHLACCLLLGGAVSACAANTRPVISTRAGSQAIVYVEGRGTISSPGLGIKCGPGVPEADNQCVGWGLPIRVALVADPEPGWKFERWESRRLEPGCDPSYVFAGARPSAGPTYAYTAIFVQ